MRRYTRASAVALGLYITSYSDKKLLSLSLIEYDSIRVLFNSFDCTYCNENTKLRGDAQNRF